MQILLLLELSYQKNPTQLQMISRNAAYKINLGVNLKIVGTAQMKN